MVGLLKHYKPGMINMQEVVHNQLTYLVDNLQNFTYIGVGREDGKQKGEYSPIFQDTSSYNLLKSETFWVSDTRDKISVGWYAVL